jgi:hypothetical protein
MTRGKALLNWSGGKHAAWALSALPWVGAVAGRDGFTFADPVPA